MEWPCVELREIAQVLMGQSPPGDTYNHDGDGLPFFQGKADFGDIYPTGRKWCSKPTRVARAGDLLLSVRAPVGPTNTARETCCVGRGLAAIRANKALVEPDYLRFFFKHQEAVLSSQGQGSTFAAISRGEVESIRLPLPPLPEQRQIVEVLDQADHLRRLCAEAEAKINRLCQVLFRTMFGNPGRSWGFARLGDLLRKKKGALQSGPFGTHLHNSDFVRSGTVLAVGMDNVLDGEFVLGRNRRITDQKYRDLAKYTLERGDVLITIMGTVGRTCVFPGTTTPSICTKHVYRIQTDERIHPEYLSATLRFSTAARSQIGAGITGQTVAGIKSEHLRQLQLHLPPKEVQAEFAAKKGQIDKIRDRGLRVEDQLDALFSLLVSCAFSANSTASWRKTHMEEVVTEMKQQTKEVSL